MEIKQRIILTDLTKNGVSVLRQRFFIDENGREQPIGLNHRKAYSNEEEDIERLQQDLEPEYVNAILALWADNTADNTSEPNGGGA